MAEIITSLNSEGPIDHHEMALKLSQLYDRKADSLYVIMDDKHTTVVRDPGLNRPWCSPNAKLAELTARDTTRASGRKTHVVTLNDAIKFLCGEHMRSQ